VPSSKFGDERKWRKESSADAEIDCSTASEEQRPSAEEQRPSALPATAAPGSADQLVKRATSDWIAEVSHELRLPIANLKLLVETLLDGALEDEDTARRMLNRAKSEVDRLQSLVVNLLSVEEVAATRRQVFRQFNQLSARAAYAIETTGKIAAEKNIAIKVNVRPDHKIFANTEMLDQVLLNLLENAVKFTKPKGTITIESGSVDGVFSVTDTGIGMPAHEIPKIFQRFYRIDRAHSKGSTGLGLSIVKHIVDVHGAKINVRSEEGKGSTFELIFPSPTLPEESDSG
jgi:two-component system phosphate regulon sensor histidine kinase PhoR